MMIEEDDVAAEQAGQARSLADAAADAFVDPPQFIEARGMAADAFQRAVEEASDHVARELAGGWLNALPLPWADVLHGRAP